MKKSQCINFKVISDVNSPSLDSLVLSLLDFPGISIVEVTATDVAPLELYYSAQADIKFGSCKAITLEGEIVEVTCTLSSSDDVDQEYCWKDKVHLGKGWRL